MHKIAFQHQISFEVIFEKSFQREAYPQSTTGGLPQLFEIITKSIAAFIDMLRKTMK